MSQNFLSRVLVLSLAMGGVANADLSLKWSGGVMGNVLDMNLSGDAGEGFLLIPSFNAGPLPLSLIDPNDPRVLSVGVDLPNAWTFGTLDASGSSTIQFGVPLNAIFVGLEFHAQALTVPGALFTVDDVSQPIQFALAPPGGTTQALGDLALPRRFAALAELNDGRVLTVGGQSPASPTQVFGSWEVFNPQTQSFAFGSAAPGLARSHAEAVTLNDGRVLVIGGVGNGNAALATCSLFDPDRNTFGQAAPMASGRVLFSASLLPNGRVLVVGGSSAFDKEHPFGYPASVGTGMYSTSEIYDPVADVWGPGPDLPNPLTAPTCVSIIGPLGLPLILISGGIRRSQGTLETSADAFIYNPGTGGLTQVGDQPVASFHGAGSPTVLGDAIIAGGSDVDFAALSTVVLDTTLIFRGATLTWETGPPLPGPIRCALLVCIRRGDGTYVYPMGGGLESLDLVTGDAVANTKIFELNASLTGWITSGLLTKERMGVRVATIDDGLRLLYVGAEAAPAGGIRDLTADVFVVE